MTLGEEHLARLSLSERTPPSEQPRTGVPRVRRLGRRLWSGWIWLIEIVVRPWKYVWNPRRPFGRWWAHLRLMAPTKTINWWKFLLFLFAVAMGALSYTHVKAKVWFVSFPLHGALLDEQFWADTTKTLFTGALVALLFALWSDLFRSPWLCYRVRRQIRKSPACVLHDNLDARPVTLLPRDDSIEIAPRNEIFDELLPGILARDQKDVQILVGEPGSGKTTAIVSLSKLLARIGIVPVVVPLRAREKIELVPAARDQFKRQIDRFVRSESEAESLWRWLYHRRRVAILTDDIDQIGSDGERGFILRHALEEAATFDLPVIVTARPAGVPAGIAASAINVGPLDEATAARCAEQGARSDPAFRSSYRIERGQLQDWIREGRLAEVPFYLELLASLAAVDRCPKLPELDPHAAPAGRPGRYRRTPDGRYEWNPLWVRFLLLDRLYVETAAGRVRRWLGIEAGERRSSLLMLEGAALGTLAAAGLRAKAAQTPTDQGEPANAAPCRERIRDFLLTDDRELVHVKVDGNDGTPVVHRRARVSAHEAADTGERLRLLDRDTDGALQFRHRIMQAYLAGSRLAVISYERIDRGEKIERPEPDPESTPADEASKPYRWLRDLLDPHHPERLTAQMTLVFAALSATVESEGGEGLRRVLCDGSTRDKSEVWSDVAKEIVRELTASAKRSLDEAPGAERDVLPVERLRHRLRTGLRGRASAAAGTVVSPAGTRELREPPDGDPSAELDPTVLLDPEQRRDPDDALMKLTAAAEIAHAIDADREAIKDILESVRRSSYATRWTKRDAIYAIARLGSAGGARRGAGDGAPETGSTTVAKMSWLRIWEFARDEDHAVRQAAGEVLCADAYNAYRALVEEIDDVILDAGCRSALGLPLLVDGDSSRAGGAEGGAAVASSSGTLDTDDRRAIENWREDRFLSLKALGGVLPAIVSGLHEDPDMHPSDAWRGRVGGAAGKGERPSRGATSRPNVAVPDGDGYGALVLRARCALDRLVAIAFQGGQHQLEDSLGCGFKGDAMRHAHARDAIERSKAVAGPGWVAANRRLVLAVCLGRAESWYARLLLNQALALYTIAGGKRNEALDAFSRHVHRGREHHPFTQRGTRLARAAVMRRAYPTATWHAFIWDDEDEVAGRRQVTLNARTAQLAGDVALLLDLNEGSSGECQEPFGGMNELPYCLSKSHDRQEILGKGCPEVCGWNFCPYKQPPPDEPSSQRGVSRAFSRQQRQIARHRRPRWQRHIHKRRLKAFWREMERRART